MFLCVRIFVLFLCEETYNEKELATEQAFVERTVPDSAVLHYEQNLVIQLNAFCHQPYFFSHVHTTQGMASM